MYDTLLGLPVERPASCIILSVQGWYNLPQYIKLRRERYAKVSVLRRENRAFRPPRPRMPMINTWPRSSNTKGAFVPAPLCHRHQVNMSPLCSHGWYNRSSFSAWAASWRNSRRVWRVAQSWCFRQLPAPRFRPLVRIIRRASPAGIRRSQRP